MLKYAIHTVYVHQLSLTFIVAVKFYVCEDYTISGGSNIARNIVGFPNIWLNIEYGFGLVALWNPGKKKKTSSDFHHL